MEGTSLSSVEASDTQQISFDDSDLLHLLLDNSQDCIYYKDKESRFIKVNKKTVEVLGAENSKDVIGKSNDDFFPDIADRTRADELRIMETGQPQLNEEMNILFADGSMHWVSVSKVPFYDDQGDVVGIIGISRDITRQKTMEHALQEREKQLKNTEQIGRIGNGSWDVKKNEIYWSEVMYDLYERDPELGPPSYDEVMSLYHPDTAELLEKAVKYAVEKKEGYNLDLKVSLPSGKLAYHSVIGKPVTDEKGNVILLISTVQDITKRKKIEQEIKDKAETLREAQDIAVFGSWKWDPNKETIWWSEKLYDIFGVDKDFSLSFDAISELVHPDDRGRNNGKVSTLLKTGHVEPFEIRIINPNGKIKWIYQKIITEKDDDGKVKYFKGTIQDITERKKIEIKLKKSEERFKILFENAPDGIYLMDMKGQFVDGNKAAEKICGFKKEELIGKNLYESKLLSKKQLPIALKIIAKNKLGKTSGPDELILLSKTGEKIPIEIHTYPVKIENKRYVLGIARDITVRKEAEHELKESEEKLRNLVESTSEFIWEVDKNGVYTFVSKNCLDIIGFSSSEVIGKTPFDFMNEEEAERVGKCFSDVLKEKKKISQLEDTWIHKDGSEIVFETDATPLFDENGDVTGYFGICRDITKRKIAEESLKKQSVLLAEAEKIAHIGGSEWHIRDNKFTISEEWKRIHGCKSDVLTMKDLMKIAHPEDRAKIKKAFQDALEGNKPYDIEHRIIRQDDGKERIVRASGVLIKDEHEKPIKMYGIAQDITKQKETESRYNMIMENADVWINMTTFSTDPVYTYVNPSGGGPMQYKDDELIGKHVFDFMHPEDKQKLQPMLKKFVTMKEKNLLSELEKNLPQSFEWRFKDKKGKWHYLNTVGNIADGELLFISMDITEKKHAEQALKESEKEKQLILDSVSEAVNFNDTNLVVKWINPAGAKSINKKPEEVIGKHCYEIWARADKPCVDCPVAKSFETGEIWKKEKKTPDGRIWSVSGTPVRNENNEIIGAVETSVEITDIRKYQDQLENHKVILQTVNKELTRKVKQRTRQIEKLLKQKDEFINQLGHDLKNPLGPFVQLLPILKRHAENEKDKEMIDVLDRNAWYMRNLVKKTIELAKLNSSKTVFSFEPTDISKLIKNIIKINKPMFDENKISVENNISKSYDLQVDPLHIQEVFTNVFNNVVKYTDGPGTITIDAEKQKDHLLVSIKDTGIGIDEEQMQYLFDEYYKADKSRHDFDSSGLGLPICKRIIEKHNGKIWAESKGIGKGSTFYFTLPFYHDDE